MHKADRPVIIRQLQMGACTSVLSCYGWAVEGTDMMCASSGFGVARYERAMFIRAIGRSGFGSCENGARVRYLT